ncbi:hypothetical protein P6U16_16495 [Rhizobium sp. 32-5/1]|uniref:alpha/beta fold hydrolase n=1 Tax=Rhizobium sp. 32-5/1 TaxID=3019602 RepID=UPI00240DF12F|nr:hypothetical protein [Rhizobium sp. 32-5/1]WEZ82634.1 hypothetical protein P6U16_16495 [Rhizobium sp. 32-5/1]
MVQRLAKPKVTLQYLEAMLESELPDDSAILLNTPTIIIGGSRDQFFAEAMVEAHAYAPNLKTAIFEGETHMFPIERAKAVKKIVSGFLGLEDIFALHARTEIL